MESAIKPSIEPLHDRCALRFAPGFSFRERPVSANKFRAEQRNHGHRDDVRGEKRQNNRQGQRREKKTTDPVQENYREKKEGCGESGSKNRKGHFTAAFFGCDWRL